jgi:hypothetical protein
MLRLYDYKCPLCGQVTEHVTREGDIFNCLDDGEVLDRMPPIFNINMGAAGAHGYYDENLGCYISTNSQRREEMRKQGVIEKGATPKPDGEAWV